MTDLQIQKMTLTKTNKTRIFGGEIMDKHEVTVHITPAHGHWIICSDGYYPYCSECNKEPRDGERTKQCPNCGAIMDL